MSLVEVAAHFGAPLLQFCCGIGVHGLMVDLVNIVVNASGLMVSLVPTKSTWQAPWWLLLTCFESHAC